MPPTRVLLPTGDTLCTGRTLSVTQGEPGERRSDRRSPQRRVPAGQVVLAVLAGLGSLPPLYLAFGSILSDLGRSGEKFDGLGLAIGAAMLVPLVLGAVAAGWWWWRGRGTRGGWVALTLAVVLVAAELVWLRVLGWA